MGAARSGNRPSRSKKARRRHVLVVDREVAICDLVKSILEDTGIRVSCAASARDARAILRRRRRFDLAFVDVVLPDAPGEELADDFMARGTAVVLISGHPEGIRRGPASRYTFLQKPFRVIDLLRVTLQTMVEQTED